MWFGTAGRAPWGEDLPASRRPMSCACGSHGNDEHRVENSARPRGCGRGRRGRPLFFSARSGTIRGGLDRTTILTMSVIGMIALLGWGVQPSLWQIQRLALIYGDYGEMKACIPSQANHLRHLLNHQKELGLTEEQVKKLKAIELDFDRARIRLEAEIPCERTGSPSVGRVRRARPTCPKWKPK